MRDMVNLQRIRLDGRQLASAERLQGDLFNTPASSGTQFSCCISWAFKSHGLHESIMCAWFNMLFWRQLFQPEVVRDEAERQIVSTNSNDEGNRTWKSTRSQLNNGLWLLSTQYQLCKPCGNSHGKWWTTAPFLALLFALLNYGNCIRMCLSTRFVP